MGKACSGRSLGRPGQSKDWPLQIENLFVAELAAIGTRFRSPELNGHASAAVVYASWYITDVKYGVLGGAVMLLVMAALFTAGVARQSQAPARNTANPASQDQPKNSATASASARRRKIPCKTPQNASLCYWTHGRLELYLSFHDENAPWHLWQVGTQRLLQICNGPSHFPPRNGDDCITPEFPANLDRIYKDPRNWAPSFIDDTRLSPLDVFADFEICPLEAEKKGKMQAVCIESARKILVEK